MSVTQAAAGSELKRELLSLETNTFPKLSPDGGAIAFVKTVDEGQEIWFRRVEGLEHRVAMHHRELIRDLRWTADGALLFYRHAQRGREYWSLSALRAASHDRVTIPAAGSVTEYWLSQSDPSVAAYSSRKSGSPYSELFQVCLAAAVGDPVVLASDSGFHQWLVDGDLLPRGGIRIVEDGSAEVILGDSLDMARTVLKIDVDAAVDLSVQRFSRDGRHLFLLTSYAATTRRLISINSESGAISTVFEHPDLDIESTPISGEGVWFDPRTGRPDICSVMGQRLSYHALVAAREPALAHLVSTETHTAIIMDRSADDRTWLIAYYRDNGPMEYHVLDPVTGASKLLLFNRPRLTGYVLPKLEEFAFVASDGRQLSGYALRPLNCRMPLPTVVIVHGGPAGRDFWHFHADAQYLASLGYLSLHINYRGSRGFGIDFRRAGYGEWGGRMQQDLYDAVASGVAAGLVDRNRVAFFGGSYGGYASLLAVCARPSLVRCAIAISAFCDLGSLISKPPPYWQPLALLLRRQILGTGGSPHLGKDVIEQRSPIHLLDKSCAPVLLAHGARDPRVPVAEADQFAAKARALGVPIRYLRFVDEGHYVKSNPNREILFQAVEEFLEVHLAAR